MRLDLLPVVFSRTREFRPTWSLWGQRRRPEHASSEPINWTERRTGNSAWLFRQLSVSLQTWSVYVIRISSVCILRVRRWYRWHFVRRRSFVSGWLTSWLAFGWPLSSQWR